MLFGKKIDRVLNVRKAEERFEKKWKSLIA